MKKISRTSISFVSIGLLLFALSSFCWSENVAKGNIIGFVFGQDGTTPLEGAVVKIKNVTTGTVYESNKSNAKGVFRIVGIESGIYLCGVRTDQGDYNAEDLFGVKVSKGETAKLSIALTPYEQKVATALQEVYKGQSISGESLVGTVVDYYPDKGAADTYIVKGMLQLNDRIHVKGKSTDFYQNVKDLKLGTSPAKRVLAGQTANLGVSKSVKNGDLVYVVCKRGILPLFLAPLGYATLIGGSLGIILGVKDSLDREAHITSPFKKK